MRVLTLIFALLLAPVAHADESAPFVNESTFLVVRLDVARLDPAPLVEEMARALPAALDEPADGAFARSIRDGLDDFRARLGELREAGIDVLWVVGSVEGLPDDAIVLAARPGRGADEGAIARCLEGFHGRAARRIGDAIVSGTDAALARTEALTLSERPDVTAALDRAGDGAMRVVFAPPAFARRAFLELMPSVPVFDEAALATFGEGFRWLALGASADGFLPIALEMQCGDETAARDVAALLPTAMRALVAMAGDDPAEAEAATERLRPSVHGAAARLAIDGPRFQAIADGVAPMLRRARAQAEVMKTASQVRSLLMGCHVYASDHDNAFPQTLDALVDGGFITADMLRSSTPGSRGFVYYRPDGLPWKQAATVVVVHDDVTEWPANGVPVGFLDGHVELLVDRERFDMLIAETEKLGSTRVGD